MSEKRMQLYLGKCIEDLDQMYSVPDLKQKKARLLCNTALKLFEKAEKSREKGDEETSYVYYMKYLRVVAYLSKDNEYLSDKKFFNELLGVKNPNKAISMAEVLKTSLIKRYDDIRKKQRMNEMKDYELYKSKIDSDIVKAKSHQPTIKDVQMESYDELPESNIDIIECKHLFQLMKMNKFNIMLLDTRSAFEYQQSHITHDYCISVPEEFITPGKSAYMLEQHLPEKSKSVWHERQSMDLIVMIDWCSTNFVPGKPLYLLKSILTSWDVNVKYKRLPVLLHKGYEEWLHLYPSYTTNSQVVPPNQDTSMDDMLNSIDYPNWMDLSPVSTRAPVNLSMNDSSGNPIVDRSSKAAALITYQEKEQNMEEILKQQVKLADTSLDIAKQRVQAEEDWKNIHERTEVEPEDTLKASYQLREQEILSQLMQLENKQHDMALENQKLREQLEEYQNRDRKEESSLSEQVGNDTTTSADLETSTELEASRLLIEESQRKREVLDQQRLMLEEQRMKRLEHARQMKKPKYDKEEEDMHLVREPLKDGSSNLNRSRSSPNIAKLNDEGPDVPQFDRSAKPAMPDHTYQRDFEPVFGNVGRGLTGLKNLGNTCYMNSIIQCLNNTAILTPYFCNGKYREHVNRTQGTRGVIAEEMAAVIRALWSGQYRFIAIKDLRNVVGKHQSMFRGFEQQDSHEFLTILMDWLHDDLQFTIKPPAMKDRLPPSEKAWHEYTKLRESLILRLFYGQIKSTVRCTVCGKESVTYESFSNLSLELPSNANRCTLTDCLRLYLNGETIPGWNCPSCKDKRNAFKKLDISRLPPVLVIHFKRFYADPKDYGINSSYHKKQTYIDFPLEGLDMGAFVPDSYRDNIYSLYGVSNHYGSMEGGHYTAYCKSSVYGKWYKYDDHLVTEISSSEVKSSAAYILFYTTLANTT